MDLSYGYDWSRRQMRIVSGRGPKPLWSREYAEAVLSGDKDEVLASVFTAVEPPMTQVRVDADGRAIIVRWIDESGRTERSHRFLERIPGWQDKAFPEGSDVRVGETFLHSITQNGFYEIDGKRRHRNCVRSFRSDGSAQMFYELGRPDSDEPFQTMTDYEFDPEIDVDALWRPKLTKLGYEDIKSLLVRDRPGVPAVFDPPSRPED